MTNAEHDPLPSWSDGAAKKAIVEFVQASDAVPVAERVAVFDNDGTLWCEKPMPIQLDFILRRLMEMAEAKPESRDNQPWKAAHERDYGWLGALMAEHYAGDDTNVKILGAGILAAYEGISVEDFEAQADEFDDGGREFDYTSGAEQAIDQTGKDGWTVVSIKNDWTTVF